MPFRNTADKQPGFSTDCHSYYPGSGIRPGPGDFNKASYGNTISGVGNDDVVGLYDIRRIFLTVIWQSNPATNRIN